MKPKGYNPENHVNQRFGRFTRPKRLDLRFVTWTEGEKLLHEGWTIAKEEDKNNAIGWVWLELLERTK